MNSVTIKNSMTIPNGITIGRLVLGVYGVSLLKNSNGNIGQALWGIGCFIVSMLLDYVDGWLARRFNWKSRFGEIIDPIADKVTFYNPVFLLFYPFVSMIILAPLMMYDALSTWLHIKSSGGAVSSGKNKFAIACIGLVMFLFAWLGTEKFVHLSNSCIQYCSLIANTALAIAVVFAFNSLRQRWKR